MSASPECLKSCGESQRLRTGSPAHCCTAQWAGFVCSPTADYCTRISFSLAALSFPPMDSWPPWAQSSPCWCGVRVARVLSLETDKVWNVALAAILSAVVGSRILLIPVALAALRRSRPEHERDAERGCCPRCYRHRGDHRRGLCPAPRAAHPAHSGCGSTQPGVRQLHCCHRVPGSGMRLRHARQLALGCGVPQPLCCARNPAGGAAAPNADLHEPGGVCAVRLFVVALGIARTTMETSWVRGCSWAASRPSCLIFCAVTAALRFWVSWR